VEVLFQKISDKEVKAQEEKLVEKSRLAEEAAKGIEHEPVRPEITFPDFEKMDIRIGTVVTAEKVKKSGLIYFYGNRIKWIWVKSRFDNHIKESISKPELFWYNVVIVTKQ